ncbi:uncharacterized protein LOC116110454 [Pistacia vera]|uniref:uncharacterized protein LOC116110454 n=1 Tax=Pistacia vera TaxID=55513 RepID=UPI001263E20A|nr:uncharacterized protein LOC116110454 [Pistacia vera]
MDSGATDHVTSDLNQLSASRSYDGIEQLQVGSDSLGSVEVSSKNSTNSLDSVEVSNYVRSKLSSSQSPSITCIENKDESHVTDFTSNNCTSLLNNKNTVQCHSIPLNSTTLCTDSDSLHSLHVAQLHANNLNDTASNNSTTDALHSHSLADTLHSLDNTDISSTGQLHATSLYHSDLIHDTLHSQLHDFSAPCSTALVSASSKNSNTALIWHRRVGHPHAEQLLQVFRIKYNPYGSLKKYKARLVAKGFQQTPSLDCFETFNLVIEPSTIRIILTLPITNGLDIQQIDINNAFLNGTLNETVFMKQPEGFEHLEFPGYVCKLEKALYGLK